MAFFPSPRDGGEKVPSVSEADEGLRGVSTTTTFFVAREAPHPPFGHLLPAVAGRREEMHWSHVDHIARRA
jgi:hypothetical protein